MRFRNLLSASAFVAFCLGGLAQDASSLLPVFGAAGANFTLQCKGGHRTAGWLPNGWLDNSEWAGVSAIYSQLEDPPKAGVTAVRIQADQVNDGSLQLTSHTEPTFKKDVNYVVSGWIRGPDSSGIQVGLRQPGPPYEIYFEKDLDSSAKWEPFTFDFSFTQETQAIVMFIKQQPGSVDLAGISVQQK